MFFFTLCSLSEENSQILGHPGPRIPSGAQGTQPAREPECHGKQYVLLEIALLLVVQRGIADLRKSRPQDTPGSPTPGSPRNPGESRWRGRQYRIAFLFLVAWSRILGNPGPRTPKRAQGTQRSPDGLGGNLF